MPIFEKMPGEQRQSFVRRIRRETLANLPRAQEWQVEEAMSIFADHAEPRDLFNLSLKMYDRFNACAVHFIARAATPDALTWLRKRAKQPLVQEAMDVWLISAR